MEAASRALVQRRYFDCERLCVEALERSFIAADYERMARILLPLEEARRQKRDLAFDTRDVFVVDRVVPTGRNLRPGCYLVAPPRVGIDGRLLREAANKKKIPTIVVVREPESRDGMWPVVSIGPVTIRTKVPPPPSPPGPAHTSETNGRSHAKQGARVRERRRRRLLPRGSSLRTPSGSSGRPRRSGTRRWPARRRRRRLWRVSKRSSNVSRPIRIMRSCTRPSPRRAVRRRRCR